MKYKWLEKVERIHGFVGQMIISADSVRLEMHGFERHAVFFVSHPLCSSRLLAEITHYVSRYLSCYRKLELLSGSKDLHSPSGV